jgi:hypothetical protein
MSYRIWAFSVKSDVGRKRQKKVEKKRVIGWEENKYLAGRQQEAGQILQWHVINGRFLYCFFFIINFTKTFRTTYQSISYVKLRLFQWNSIPSFNVTTLPIILSYIFFLSLFLPLCLIQGTNIFYGSRCVCVEKSKVLCSRKDWTRWSSNKVPDK